MWRKIVIILCILFVGQCLLHYFSQRPLWLDEDYVFQSIATYQPMEIFGPLKTHQAFPRIHLFLITIFSAPFGNHVLALRFFALIAMLAAFLIWFKLYQKEFSAGPVLALLVLSFACSYRLTYYAAELKPYAMDVLVVAVYALFFRYQYRCREMSEPNRFMIAAAIALPTLVFFSYAGFFVMWISAYNFLVMSLKNKKCVTLLILNIVAIALSLIALYHVDLKHFMYYKGYYQYWNGSFLDTSSVLAFLDPFFEGIKKIVTYWNGTNKAFVQASVIFMPFFLFAIFYYGFRYFKEDRGGIYRLDTLALVLFFELIVFGILRKYPFTGERVTLFMAPLVFYLILKGMDALKRYKYLRCFFLGYYGIYSLVCLVNTFLIHLALY
ncbi:MAG: hypothetical protein KC684_00945 [Candidatus Omnitrophica bacterium]|nr:hypothetical protein [Candidatus Omnitrophota bacterium]